MLAGAAWTCCPSIRAARSTSSGFMVADENQPVWPAWRCGKRTGREREAKRRDCLLLLEAFAPTAKTHQTLV